MAGRKVIFKKELVEEFLNSDETYILLDWETLGYSSLKNAHFCVNYNLNYHEYPCSCQMRNGKIYLVKKGYKLRKTYGRVYPIKIKEGDLYD